MAKSCLQVYPDLQKPFVLHVDASKFALGATLSQEDESGSLRLLTCTSQKFNNIKRSYRTHERELLAMVHAFGYWKYYLMGGLTTVYTDRTYLLYLTTMQPSERMVRWLGDLALYHFEVKHIPGQQT